MAKDKAYREAETKIEEALRTGANELDLSGSPVRTHFAPASFGGVRFSWRVRELVQRDLAEGRWAETC